MQIDFHEFIESLNEIVELKDTYTRGHSNRVAEISTLIAKSLNLSNEDIFLTHISGHLHDIGKIGIPDQILLKKGKLTNEEYETIKLHPNLGYNILKKVKNMKNLAIIIKHHHERWDGKGYPDNLKGDDIPLISRIISIADAFDAMNSSRSYRNKLEIDYILNEIKNNLGTQFDPIIGKRFLEIFEKNSEFFYNLYNI
ncbi:MAG: hypothetical protein PWP46_1060 [Fusobacteriaceae bacterium]|jgi:HD-GYP domain-containing protein (c-di-GMP phosphodiesterase class II)|nr:hypothetical protein [Fusobacteriaceae bacterium]